MPKEKLLQWKRSFREYTNRKIDEAWKATIPGFTTLIDNSAQFALESIQSRWTNDLYGGPFFRTKSVDERFPSVNTVFVQDKNGNTGTDQPADLGGGETDHKLIYEGLTRVYVDAVMAGANTVRGAQMVLSVWHPDLYAMRTLGLYKPRHPAQIVVTSTGRINLTDELMFNVPDIPVFILTTDAGSGELAEPAKERPWITIITTGSAFSLTPALKVLKRTYAIETISCIGGRTLASALIDEGLIQDLYLTTTPKEGGQPNTPYYVGKKEPSKMLVLAKTGQGQEEGVTFDHFVYV